MTPKEKAIELVSKFRNEFGWVEKDYNVDLYRDTKQCALIAVDEIINSVDNEHVSDIFNEFWQNVKQEIEKL